MFSFLHVADIHLDSPLRGLSRYEGAPVDEIRGATRLALTNLIDYALDNSVPLLVLAGDVYDADCPDFQTLLHFARQMSRLREADIRVVMIRGNHDADNAMTAALRLPDNVVILPSANPGTWRSETLPLAVHGQSYPGREITANLVLNYPAPLPGLFNIGLLHTALTGRPGYAPYAPCSLADLAAKGYDYWALGHVHEFEQISRVPHAVFSGCLQGRHVREPGPKGCVRVDVEEGHVATQHITLDVLRWAELDVNVSGARSLDDVHLFVGDALQDMQNAQEGRLLAVRIRLYGRCPLHAQIIRNPEHVIAQIRLNATDLSGHRVWVEKVLLDTTPNVDLDDILRGNTPQAALLRALQEMGNNPASLDALGVDFRDLQAKLGGHASLLPDLNDPETRSDLIQNIQNLLLSLLIDTAHAPPAMTAPPDNDHAH